VTKYDRAYIDAVAERYALPGRIKAERAARYDWPFQAALALARGLPVPAQPRWWMKAQERAALLEADREVVNCMLAKLAAP
jgi:hypothetical protein